MKKERLKNMRVITSDAAEIKPSDIKIFEPEDNKVYQSNPLKSDLYSKLLAYRQSQKKFTVQDLIRDSLK